MNTRLVGFLSIMAAIIMADSNAYAITTCMQCKMSDLGGVTATECSTRCKDCCEAECIDYRTECSALNPPTTGCLAGQYGLELSCRDCPADDITHANVTSLYGANTLITSCYIPMGASFYDDAGKGTYEQACYYTN